MKQFPDESFWREESASANKMYTSQIPEAHEVTQQQELLPLPAACPAASKSCMELGARSFLESSPALGGHLGDEAAFESPVLPWMAQVNSLVHQARRE